MKPSVYRRRWVRIAGLYVTCWIGFPRMKRALKRLERLRKRKEKNKKS